MHNKLSTTILLILIIFSSCSKDRFEEVGKPNIIFIISDDQDYRDYGFMGHQAIETPHIDRLAQESLTFTRGYASAPLCSPSLASIITGLYPFQHGITGNDPVVDYTGPRFPKLEEGAHDFPPDSYPVRRDSAYQILAENFYKNKLITETLAEQGYRSFQSGKWWVGSAEDAGFDSGMTHGDYTRGGRHGDEGLKIGREGLKPIYDFIESTSEEGSPFFVWYAPFLPHTPHTPPRKLEEKYRKLTPDSTVAKYWAMVEWFDQTVGDLQKFLREKGLDENTLIVYTCDNGWIQDPSSNSYASRSKRSPFEGGIRTPIMFKYPKVISPKRDDKHVISNVDIVPTIHSILGIDQGNLPGINVLDEHQVQNRTTVFAEAYDHDIENIQNPTETLLYQIAIEYEWKIMIPNSKMIQQPGETKEQLKAGYYSNEIQLYNLKTDPFEKNNISEQHPEQVERLRKKIFEWYQ